MKEPFSSGQRIRHPRHGQCIATFVGHCFRSEMVVAISQY